MLGAVYFVLELAAKIIVLIQLAHVAWRGRPHARISEWANWLANYLYRLWGYVMMADDECPWPFGPLRGPEQVRRKAQGAGKAA